MHKSRVITKWFCTGIFLVFMLGGCAIWDRFFSEEEIAPDELMSQGMEKYEGGYFEAATEAFQKIKDRYPYSKFAVTAELKMADCLYKRKLYDEGFEAYDEFERMHPKNPNIPYVIYRKGMCHFSQVNTIDRDQSNTLQAKEEFERLVKKFSKTEYANKARAKIRKCYIYLAEYELYVGRFYYKKKKYRAAMDRYRYILANYPDLGQYHEALEILGKCKEKLAKEGKEEEKISQEKAPVALSGKPTIEGPRPQKEKPINEKTSEDSKSSLPKKSGFSVQVGAFLGKENAEKLKAALMQDGYKPFIFRTLDSKKRKWYCVRIGNYASSEEASRAASVFIKKQKMPAIVTATHSQQPVEPKQE